MPLPEPMGNDAAAASPKLTFTLRHFRGLDSGERSRGKGNGGLSCVIGKRGTKQASWVLGIVGEVQVGRV